MSGSPASRATDRSFGRSVLIALAALGVLAAALGWIFQPRAFAYGYLAAWLLWLGAPLGCAVTALTWRTTDGGWGRILGPATRAGTITFPIFILLFIPIALTTRTLFPWANPEAVASSHSLQQKAPYLNETFFLIRAAAYFLIWLVSAWAIIRTTPAPDQPLRRAGGPAGLALVIYFLTVTFAGIDWIASLEPQWYSSIFGMYLFTSQLLTAFCVLLISVLFVPFMPLVPPTAALSGRCEIPAASLNKLGNLLLMLVVLRTYLAFSQFFIIWNGNLPEETTWYIPRATGPWGWLAVFLMILHFGFPFCALLFRSVKQRPAVLGLVAIVLLLAQALDYAWMVIPSAPRAEQPLAIVFALASAVGVGSLWLLLFLWRWSREPRLIGLVLEEEPSPPVESAPA